MTWSGSKTYRAQGDTSQSFGVYVISLLFRHRFQYTWNMSTASIVYQPGETSRGETFTAHPQDLMKPWKKSLDRPMASKTTPIPWRIHGWYIDLWICYGFMDPFSVIPIYVYANIKGVYWWDPCPWCCHFFGAPWIPSIYPSHVTIYSSTMDPSWELSQVHFRDGWQSPRASSHGTWDINQIYIYNGTNIIWLPMKYGNWIWWYGKHSVKHTLW